MSQANITGGYYDLVNVTQGGDLISFVQNVNDLTGQWLMFGVLVVGFGILLMSMLNRGVKAALAASTFITSVLSIFFLTMEFISFGFFLIIIIPSAVVYAMVIIQGN